MFDVGTTGLLLFCVFNILHYHFEPIAGFSAKDRLIKFVKEVWVGVDGAALHDSVEFV